ncbi:MAG: hypothetical protein ABIY70_06610 [Capsulimonas sp.]|uniref:PBECR3 domain-containing polyvalent protein n=1 Tax=Capsulimonas sp. TaxID=2494211 RepID=UPI0032631498
MSSRKFDCSFFCACSLFDFLRNPMPKAPPKLPSYLSTSPDLGFLAPLMPLAVNAPRRVYQDPPALRFDPNAYINQLGPQLPLAPSHNRAPAPRPTPQQQAHERNLRLAAQRQALAASLRGSFPATRHPDGSVTSRDPGIAGTPLYNAILQNGTGLKIRRWDPSTDTTTAYFNDGSHATFGNVQQGGRHLSPHQIEGAQHIAAMKAEYAATPNADPSNWDVLRTMAGDGLHAAATGIDGFQQTGSEGAEKLNNDFRYWMDAYPGTWRANAIHKYQELTGTVPPPQRPSIGRPDPWRDFRANPVSTLVKSAGGVAASTMALPGAVVSAPVQVGRAAKSAIQGDRERAINTMYDLGASAGPVPTALIGVLEGGYQAVAGRTDQGKKTAQDTLGKLFGDDLPADPFGTVLSGAPFYHGVGMLGDLRRTGTKPGSSVTFGQRGESGPGSTSAQDLSGERSVSPCRKVVASPSKASPEAYLITKEDANTALTAIKAQTEREKTHAALSSLDEERKFNNAAIYGAYKLIKSSGKILWPEWQNQMATEVGSWTKQDLNRLWNESHKKYRHSTSYEGHDVGQPVTLTDGREYTIHSSDDHAVRLHADDGSPDLNIPQEAWPFLVVNAKEVKLSPSEIVSKKVADLWEWARERTSTKKIALPISQATERQIADIKANTPYDVSGYTHVVDSYIMNHIDNEHAKEPRIGQLPITREDIENIPEILANYDKIEDATIIRKNKDGSPRVIKGVRYQKRMGAHYLLVEEINDGKNKNLVLKSIQKYPIADEGKNVTDKHSRRKPDS